MTVPGPPPDWAAAAAAVAHVFCGGLSDTLEIAGADGHHLSRVRRLRTGEAVTAADGAGRWRSYEVAQVDQGRLTLHATSGPRVEPVLTPQVVVALALTKGGLDDVAARLTELGVAGIEPYRARRSVVRWDDARAARAVERLRTVTRAAAMQCRRARLPEVRAVTALEALCDRPGLVLADRTGVTPGTVPLPPTGVEWTIVVGPEGGLDESEQMLLGEATRVAVGPHVLRAETAPVAVASALVARGTVGDQCGS
ncbi:MAG: 16S rRNA (uracil(1498)-N(3))-methyltransferase [Acidimicrobiia bacterium]|nr:16S rRNA (uracil(1498)-N(3))-methyltransferase [Acidimicrobiia bacterium]